MSVLSSLTNGWIISHDNFIRQLYGSIEGNPNKSFTLDSCLFQINTPFVRNVTKKEETENSVSSSSRRGDNRRIVPSYPEYVCYVKEKCHDMIEECKKHGYLTYVPSPSDKDSNNAVARTKAGSFYLKSPVSPELRLHGENNLPQGLITQVNNESYVIPERCKFFCYDIKDIEHKMDLLMPPYDLILLDPPWWNKYIRRKRAKCVGAGYQMMYDIDLVNIPIPALTAPGSIVAVWCTNSASHLAALRDEIFPAWGVGYIGKWYWLKVTRAGVPVCQFSEPPGKQPFEQIVFGCRVGGSRDHLLPEPDRIIISVPSAIHSHKPPLSDVMAPYLPTNPRCMELFARYLLPGWTSWGNEVLKLQHLSLYRDRDIET